jgi:tight adherence protein B
MVSSRAVKQLRIEPQPEFADILRDEPFAASSRGQAGSAGEINRAFDRLILQSGTRLAGSVLLQLCLLTALAGGGTLFVVSENLLATALATGAGALVPVVLLAMRRAQRRAKFSEQFPVLVERILRSVEAGRGLEESVARIAQRGQPPLGDELRLALRRTQLGLTLGDALGELPERTGLPEMRVLVAAIGLSERHGGDPVRCLQILARSLRERSREERRWREATAIDWASGVLVFLLQAVVVWLFVLSDPEQVSRIAASRTSLALAAAAGAILIAGRYCVLRLSAGHRST